MSLQFLILPSLSMEASGSPALEGDERAGWQSNPYTPDCRVIKVCCNRRKKKKQLVTEPQNTGILPMFLSGAHMAAKMV